MSSISTGSTRRFVAVKNRVQFGAEHGQSTAEWGLAILCAVALAIAVAGIITGGVADGIFGDLIKTVLKKAVSLAGK